MGAAPLRGPNRRDLSPGGGSGAVRGVSCGCTGILGPWRVDFGGTGYLAGCPCDQIPLMGRKIRLARCILAEGRLPLHQSRPVPHPAAHGQPAGLADGRQVVPDLESRPAVAMEPEQGRELVDRRRPMGLEAAVHDDRSPSGKPGGLAMRGRVRNWARLAEGKPKFDRRAKPEPDFMSADRELIAQAAGKVADTPQRVPPGGDNARTDASGSSGGLTHQPERDNASTALVGPQTPEAA